MIVHNNIQVSYLAHSSSHEPFVHSTTHITTTLFSSMKLSFPKDTFRRSHWRILAYRCPGLQGLCLAGQGLKHIQVGFLRR